MREALFSLIASDLQLNMLGINADSLFAGDVDTPQPRPYMVLRWGDTAPGVNVVNTRQLTVWVHDKPNDYTVIDGIVIRLRAVLLSVAGYKTSNGWISAIDWITDSGDLTDDVTDTIARTSSYAIVASGG